MTSSTLASLRRLAAMCVVVLVAALGMTGCGSKHAASSSPSSSPAAAASSSAPSSPTPSTTAASPTTSDTDGDDDDDDDDDDGGDAAVPASCPAAVHAPAVATLPAGFPIPSNEHVYDKTAEGATAIYYANLPGDAGDIVTVRDEIEAALTGHGYTITDHDEEPGHEADAEFAGPQSGTVRVRALCTSPATLDVRYTFGD